MNKNKISTVIGLMRILEKEKGQELAVKLFRFTKDNDDQPEIVSILKQMNAFFGIDEKTKDQIGHLFGVYLRELYREQPQETQTLAEIWRASGRGVLIKNMKTQETFTLVSEFNDGLSVRYIIERQNKTSTLSSADELAWSVIF